MQKVHVPDGEGIVPERQMDLLQIMWAHNKPMNTRELATALAERVGHSTSISTIKTHLQKLSNGKHVRCTGSGKKFLWRPTRTLKAFVNGAAKFQNSSPECKDSFTSHGQRQHHVLSIIWAAGRPLTVPEIHDAVNADMPKGEALAYTTILTVTRNLYARRSLLRHGEYNSRLHLYIPAFTREYFQRQMLRIYCLESWHGDHKLMAKMLRKEYKET